ncbi:MAG: hypothetical protein WBL50_21900 [Candidatus Acidiferrum sp.]
MVPFFGVREPRSRFYHQYLTTKIIATPLCSAKDPAVLDPSQNVWLRARDGYGGGRAAADRFVVMWDFASAAAGLPHSKAKTPAAAWP